MNEPGRIRCATRWKLIGRDRELATLLDGLHRGNAILVRGPAGIGKTALVREAARMEHPGARLPELVEHWRERLAVVLVARSEMTIGRVWQRVWGCSRIPTGALGPESARRLIEATGAALRLDPLDDAEVHALVRWVRGIRDCWS